MYLLLQCPFKLFYFFSLLFNLKRLYLLYMHVNYKYILYNVSVLVLRRMRITLYYVPIPILFLFTNMLNAVDMFVFAKGTLIIKNNFEYYIFFVF